MIGPEPLQQSPLRVFGSWMADVPSRIGSNKTVDAAATYLLDSFEAWQIRTDEACFASRSSGIKAQKSLRLAWQKKNRLQNPDLLLAVKLHMASEVRP